MKTIRNITVLASVAIILFSCTKEKAEQPSADFKIYKQLLDGAIVETDTVKVGEYVTFEATDPAEMVVFYTGKRAYRYSKSRFFGGDNVGFVAPKGKLINVKFYLNDVGTDTVVCVATNHGNWGDEERRDVKTRYLIVSPY